MFIDISGLQNRWFAKEPECHTFRRVLVDFILAKSQVREKSRRVRCHWIPNNIIKRVKYKGG